MSGPGGNDDDATWMENGMRVGVLHPSSNKVCFPIKLFYYMLTNNLQVTGVFCPPSTTATLENERTLLVFEVWRLFGNATTIHRRFADITTSSTLENEPRTLIFEGDCSFTTSPPPPPSKTSRVSLFSRVETLWQHHHRPPLFCRHHHLFHPRKRAYVACFRG